MTVKALVFSLALVARASATPKASAQCYSTYVTFEDPQPQVTSGGVTSKGFNFPGVALIDNGAATQFPQNTGVYAFSSPNIVGYGLQSQGSSARSKPSIQVGSDFTAFSLRTMMYACMEDEAGRNASLPAVNCSLTLTCIKPGGATGGSQTLQYTYGGGTNAQMQGATLDLDTFKCCQSINLCSSTPKVNSKYTVATVIDSLTMFVTAKHPMSDLGGGGQIFCGCS